MTTKRTPEYLSRNPSQIEWAMMAAYIDGEGCIRIRTTPQKRGRSTGLLVVVSNNDPRLMQWLTERFAGFVSVRVMPHCKGVVYYNWVVNGRHAEWVLRGCLEFFVIKRDQAEIGLSHQSLIDYRRPGLSKNTIPERMALRNKLSLLKGSASLQKDENGILLKMA